MAWDAREYVGQQIWVGGKKLGKWISPEGRLLTGKLFGNDGADYDLYHAFDNPAGLAVLKEIYDGTKTFAGESRWFTHQMDKEHSLGSYAYADSRTSRWEKGMELHDVDGVHRADGEDFKWHNATGEMHVGTQKYTKEQVSKALDFHSRSFEPKIWRA